MFAQLTFFFANPHRFFDFFNRYLKGLKIAFFLCLFVGILGAILAPQDYQQGLSFKIMYVHVPCAWMAMFCYFFIALMSFFALVWKHIFADILAKAIAPLGALFTFLCLITGSLWGKPMWGTWWVWDARLTSMFVLLLLYWVYMFLQHDFSILKINKPACYLALFGLVNLPIIKYSVLWWNTLHQPASITKFAAPSIHWTMLWPLLVLFCAAKLYFIIMLAMRSETAFLNYKLYKKNILGE